MLRVAHGYHEEIIWNFMEVGHTKVRPDEGFRIIRQHVEGRSDVLCMNDMVNEIENSAQSNTCHMFPESEVQDWEKAGDYFNFLPVLKKFFTYKIRIRGLIQDHARNVVVHVCPSIAGEYPDLSRNLMKGKMQYPSFDSFDKVSVPEISKERREGLLKGVYSVLGKNRPNMSPENRKWWEGVIGTDNLPRNTSTTTPDLR